MYTLVLATIGDGAHYGGVIGGVANDDTVADLGSNALGFAQLIRRYQHSRRGITALSGIGHHGTHPVGDRLFQIATR